MRTSRRENIIPMRAPAPPVVITMPSRGRAHRAWAVVLEMPAGIMAADSSQHTVIEMPLRKGEAQNDPCEDPNPTSVHVAGIRISTVALLSWLGSLWRALAHKRAGVIEFPGSPSPDPPAASVIPRMRAA